MFCFAGFAVFLCSRSVARFLWVRWDWESVGHVRRSASGMQTKDFTGWHVSCARFRTYVLYVSLASIGQRKKQIRYAFSSGAVELEFGGARPPLSRRNGDEEFYWLARCAAHGSGSASSRFRFLVLVS